MSRYALVTKLGTTYSLVMHSAVLLCEQEVRCFKHCFSHSSFALTQNQNIRDSCYCNCITSVKPQANTRVSTPPPPWKKWGVRINSGKAHWLFERRLSIFYGVWCLYLREKDALFYDQSKCFWVLLFLKKHEYILKYSKPRLV